MHRDLGAFQDQAVDRSTQRQKAIRSTEDERIASPRIQQDIEERAMMTEAHAGTNANNPSLRGPNEADGR